MMQFNDKLGTVGSYLPVVKAYLVTLDDGSSLCVPRANLQEMAAQPKQLAKGTRVKVHGIQEPSMTQFNGKIGTSHSFHALAKAHRVTLDDGSLQFIPKANLQEVQTPPAPILPPPAGGGGAATTYKTQNFHVSGGSKSNNPVSFGNISGVGIIVTGGTNVITRSGLNSNVIQNDQTNTMNNIWNHQ